jgi:RNA polymerase sigma factor (sigma-70 family)
MADVTDQNLIRACVRGRCDQSFGELVHRHVDLVHSTALRIVRDASLAEDVTQRVFLALAKYAVNLQERPSLTGWLHETARNLAINTVRGEERRRQREQEAAAMSNLESNPLKAGLVKSPEQWTFSSARFRDEYNRLQLPAKAGLP